MRQPTCTVVRVRSGPLARHYACLPGGAALSLEEAAECEIGRPQYAGLLEACNDGDELALKLHRRLLATVARLWREERLRIAVESAPPGWLPPAGWRPVPEPEDGVIRILRPGSHPAAETLLEDVRSRIADLVASYPRW